VKKIVFGLLFSGLLGTSMAMAEVKMAVIDVQAAILSSEQAKEKIAELKKRYAPDQNELKNLAEEIQKMQAKLEQDAAVMSESEKRQLGKDIEDKAVDFQFQQKKLQKSQQESQQELMGELSPKLESAIQSVIETGEYDLILERRSLIYAKPEYDITKKITEKMNLNR